MRDEIPSKSVVSRPSGDPYLTISQVATILSKLVKMVPSPRPCRSGLVVRPPAWNPACPNQGFESTSCPNLGVTLLQPGQGSFPQQKQAFLKMA